jgi:hypothetical protein
MRSEAFGVILHTLELVAEITTSRVREGVICAAEKPCVIR